MTLTRQAPMFLILRVNQVQAIGDEDTNQEVIPEEVVTKDVADEADTSTTQNTHHESKTSRLKSTIFTQS